MRNFSTPRTDTTLESVVAEMNAHPHNYSYVSRIGLEVEGMGHRSHERHTLAPAFNSLGVAPRIGDEVECSALGSGSQWRVVAVAQGYPGQMQVRR